MPRVLAARYFLVAGFDIRLFPRRFECRLAACLQFTPDAPHVHQQRAQALVHPCRAHTGVNCKPAASYVPIMGWLR